jgi:hypothetical protein
VVTLLMTRQADHVKNRRAQGLCGREGCQVVTGDKFRCDQHAEEHRARNKALYWAKREQKARQAA